MICTICYSEIKNTIMLHKCNHSFCSDCIHTWLDFKKSYGHIPSCPNCRKRFNSGDFISVADNTNTKNFNVYLNTRNRTHNKRFHELYDHINDLIGKVNNLSSDQSDYNFYRHQHETLIIKLLKCLDHNSWFLNKYSWGRTTQKEAMRKGFISVLKEKLDIWRENGFIFANIFIFKFRKHFKELH